MQATAIDIIDGIHLRTVNKIGWFGQPVNFKKTAANYVGDQRRKISRDGFSA